MCGCDNLKWDGGSIFDHHLGGVCMYVCVYTHTHTYIHTYTYIYIFEYIRNDVYDCLPNF